MSELKHDPELPFAYVLDRGVFARFRAIEDALSFASLVGDGEVIDTTPKPKIPEDAQHITWGKGATAYSRRGDGWVGGSNEGIISEQDLIEGFIGEAEIIVLVRKEES